jgi:hypothetical protein
VLSALDVINKDRNRITFKGYGQLLQQDSSVAKADPQLEVRSCEDHTQAEGNRGTEEEELREATAYDGVAPAGN